METSLFKQLLQRRVFQIVGIYLGAVIALMEFTGMVVERYGLSDNLVDLILAGMTSFIPAVIVLAWSHGAPGKDKWGKAEKITVPANGLFTFALLSFLAFNSPSSTESASVQNQMISADSTLSKEVAQNNFQRIGVMFFDPGPQTSEHDLWMSYALTYLLSMHLSQERFLVVSSPYSDIENSFFWQMKRAGFKDGFNVPSSLKRNIARDSNFNYYTQGRLNKSENGFSVSLQIFNTESAKVVSEFSTEATNLFAATEAMTQFVKQQSALLPQGSDLINEIPINELATNNVQALKHLVEGLNHIVFNNDYELSINELKQAAALDPSFALANIHLAEILTKVGKLDEARMALDQILPYSYKVAPRMMFIVKAFGYALDNKIDLQADVYTNWMEIYPQDYQPINNLAFLMLWKKNSPAKAIPLFERSLEINQSQFWIYEKLGELYLSIDDFDNALNNLKKSSELKPDDFSPWIEMGKIAQLKGDLALARKHYQKASVLRSDKVSPVLALAGLDLREGKLQDAQDRYREAERISQAPRQQGMIVGHKIQYAWQLGQPKKAFDLLLEYQELVKQYMDPLDGMFAAVISKMYLYVYSDNTELAILHLQKLEQELDPALKDLVQFGYLFLHAALHQTEQADAAMVKVKSIVEKYSLNNMSYLLSMGQGWIEQSKRDHKMAAQHFQLALNQLNSSAQRANGQDLLPVIYDAIVEALYMDKQFELAEKYAQEYLPQWPEQPEINLHLAKICLGVDNSDCAKPYLQKAQSIWNEAEEGYNPAKETRELLQKFAL